MAGERTEAQIAAWKAGDAERNERARHERLRSAGARSLGENPEGVALTRFAPPVRGCGERPEERAAA